MASLRSCVRMILLVALVASVSAVPASAKVQALDFVRKERQTSGPPKKDVWAAIARDRDDLERLWNRYNQAGPLPTIRFKKNVAVLAGARAPSSCAHRLHDLRLDRERKRVVARMYENEPKKPVGCAAVMTPRTFTVAVARADLKPPGPRDLRVRPRIIDDPKP